MIVALGMFYIMLHGPAVDAPVTRRPVLDGLRHQVPVLLHIYENHLEPQLPPAIVAHGGSLMEPNRLLLLRG